MEISYELKRRIMMTFSTIYFFLCVVMAFSAFIVWRNAMDNPGDIADVEEYNRDNTMYLMGAGSNIGMGGVSQIIGFIGAWREQWCCAILYTILMLFAGLWGFFIAFHIPVFWFMLSVWSFCFLVQITFVRDLRIKRRTLGTGKRNNVHNSSDHPSDPCPGYPGVPNVPEMSINRYGQKF